MRALILAPILAIGTVLFLAAPADAQGRGSGCSQGGSQGDAVLCSYVSQSQCRASVSGRGGFCIQNPQLQAYGYQHSRHHRHHRR